MDKLPKGVQFNNALFDAFKGSAKAGKLADYYKVGIRGHCEGKIENGKEVVTSCSNPVNYYWFNPIEVWQLGDTTAQKLFPDEMKSALASYQKVAKWMVTAYGLALATTALEVLIGITALFSRWGSLATTVISCVRVPPFPFYPLYLQG